MIRPATAAILLAAPPALARDTGGGQPYCPNPEPEGGPCAVPRVVERSRDGTVHEVLEARPDALFDHMQMFTVPKGHVFVLGDNRCNAADSRAQARSFGRGFVPINSTTGISDRVLRP